MKALSAPIRSGTGFPAMRTPRSLPGASQVPPGGLPGAPEASNLDFPGLILWLFCGVVGGCFVLLLLLLLC